jgi:hypothetical protein
MLKRATNPAGALLAVLAATVLIPACGGGDGSDGESEGPPSASTARLIETTGLPRPSNRSMRALLENMRQGPELAPSQGLLEPGRNRFGFGLFDRANRQIGDIKVGLYVSMGLDETAHGPYPVRFERIEIADRYRSKQTAEDPDSATSYYAADLSFRRPGAYLVSAIAELGNKLVATSPVQVVVRDDSKVPGEGDRAIRVSTPTRESVGGDIKRIETRVPPDTMHEVDLADALDEGRPIVLLFATPSFCQSRVCGPVTDVAEEVKAEYGDRAEFIHVEIYQDNKPKVVRTRQGGVLLGNVRPQVRAWHLESEPFAFAINSKGVVVERLEGAFNVQELSAAVRKALR